jgi:hypothetical protein
MKASLLLVLVLAGSAAADPDILVPPPSRDSVMVIEPVRSATWAGDPDIVIGPVISMFGKLANAIDRAVHWLVTAPI